MTLHNDRIRARFWAEVLDGQPHLVHLRYTRYGSLAALRTTAYQEAKTRNCLLVTTKTLLDDGLLIQAYADRGLSATKPALRGLLTDLGRVPEAKMVVPLNELQQAYGASSPPQGRATYKPPSERTPEDWAKIEKENEELYAARRRMGPEKLDELSRLESEFLSFVTISDEDGQVSIDTGYGPVPAVPGSWSKADLENWGWTRKWCDCGVRMPSPADVTHSRGCATITGDDALADI